MTKFACHATLELPRHKERRDAFRVKAAELGIDIDDYDAEEPGQFIAVYANSLEYEPIALSAQLSKCREFAEANLGGGRIVYFVDGRFHHSKSPSPMLDKLQDHVRAGRVSAVVCNDIDTFRFARPSHFKRYLQPLVETGTRLHFAGDSFETAFLRDSASGFPITNSCASASASA